MELIRPQGANQGIGYETAKALVLTKSPAGKPYHVLIGSRTLANGEQAASELNALLERQGSAAALQIDVTDETSVAAAAAQVEKEYGRLDAVVNNAGVMPHPPVHGGVPAALRFGLDVNVIGPVMVTEAFLPLLLKDEVDDPRLVFVGTSMASLIGASDPENRYYKTVLGGSPSEYRASKAAVNMLMIEYHKRYGTRDTADSSTPGAGKRVRVWTADPGATATNFMGPQLKAMAIANGLQGPEMGCKVLVSCIVGERDGQEGKMVGVYGVSAW